MTVDPTPIITLKDVFNALSEVARGVNDLKVTTEGMSRDLKSVSKAQEEGHKDHEERLREQERIGAEVKDLPRKVEAMEPIVTSVKDLPGKVADLQRRVWAIPGIATLLAIAAVVMQILNYVKSR